MLAEPAVAGFPLGDGELGASPLGYKPPPIPVLGRASELKPTVGGVAPVVEYGLPGGTSFRMLRHPPAKINVPSMTARDPPASARLSRSIDLTSSIHGARHRPGTRRT